jgi:hypothetical protein
LHFSLSGFADTNLSLALFLVYNPVIRALARYAYTHRTFLVAVHASTVYAILVVVEHPIVTGTTVGRPRRSSFTALSIKIVFSAVQINLALSSLATNGRASAGFWRLVAPCV